MKNQKKRSWILPTAITVLVVALIGTFVLSGTLAKFITTVSGDSGMVPAAQFAFNKDDANQDITWNLDDFGATSALSNEKVFYPGAYGELQFDVSLISDVPVTSEATVESNGAGAFADDVLITDAEYSVTDEMLRNLVSVKFAIKTVDKGEEVSVDASDFAAGFGISDLETSLKAALESVLADYNDNLGVKVEKEVHLFWNWVYEEEEGAAREKADHFDTLFGNYVAMYEAENPSVASTYGIDVQMTVIQADPATY